MMSSLEINNFKFNCNIQQIKKEEFDLLFYGIFFSDSIEIFKIRSEEINNNIFYSDKQHKGNIGEGQFHINNDTYLIHKKYFFFSKLTYSELLDIII